MQNQCLCIQSKCFLAVLKVRHGEAVCDGFIIIEQWKTSKTYKEGNALGFCIFNHIVVTLKPKKSQSSMSTAGDYDEDNKRHSHHHPKPPPGPRDARYDFNSPEQLAIMWLAKVVSGSKETSFSYLADDLKQQGEIFIDSKPCKVEATLNVSLYRIR